MGLCLEGASCTERRYDEWRFLAVEPFLLVASVILVGGRCIVVAGESKKVAPTGEAARHATWSEVYQPPAFGVITRKGPRLPGLPCTLWEDPVDD